MLGYNRAQVIKVYVWFAFLIVQTVFYAYCVELIYFIVHPITLSLFMIYSHSFVGMHIR